MGLSHLSLKSLGLGRDSDIHSSLRATALVTEVGPGSLTAGHGSPVAQKAQQMLCAAGHVSAKQADSSLWAGLGPSGVEDSRHEAGPRFTAEPDATCQPCFV